MEQIKYPIEEYNFNIIDTNLKLNRTIYKLFINNNLRITRIFNYNHNNYVLDNIMVDSINFKEDFINILE